MKTTIPLKATVCPLAGASAIRIDWSGAVPDPGANFVPTPPFPQILAMRVVGGSLPLVYRGAPGPDKLDARTSAAVVADMGDGDDGLQVSASRGTLSGGAGKDFIVGGPGQMQVDAGPGNDYLGGAGEGSTLAGGPGDDRIETSTLMNNPADQARSPLSGQRVDCGEGADDLRADVRDVAGPGCAEMPAGLRERMVLGRFDEDGRLRVSLGRLTNMSTVRYRIGSRSMDYGKPSPQTIKRVRGPISAELRLLAKVRRDLRKTSRRTVSPIFANVQVRGVGAAADVTSVALAGVLKRAGR